MFKERLLDTLRNRLNSQNSDKEILHSVDKIERQEKLSSQEFLKLYDELWKEGPKVKYAFHDSREERSRIISDSV
jgi:hypothetical protein